MTTELNANIADFYNNATDLWLNNWGEHMHHGHYGRGGKTKKDNIQAQIDMIEEMLHFGKVTQAKTILDLGCGVGGSARYLADKFTAQVTGFTLSPIQVKRGNEFTKKSKIPNVKLVQKDMMTLDVQGEIDLVWSMESAEHIADKKLLFEKIYHSLLDQGKVLMATWCVSKAYDKMNAKEIGILKKIQKWYHLPNMVPLSELEMYAQEVGFKNISVADWSAEVSPFWKAVIKSAFTIKGMTGLLRSNMGTMKGAWAMRYMQKGYQSGLIRFGVLTGTK